MVVSYGMFLVFGALGGLARAVVGYVKQARKDDDFKPHWRGVLWNIGGSIIIGAVVGLVIDTNPATAIAGGYAGIDVLSNLPHFIPK